MEESTAICETIWGDVNYLQCLRPTNAKSRNISVLMVANKKQYCCTKVVFNSKSLGEQTLYEFENTSKKNVLRYAEMKGLNQLLLFPRIVMDKTFENRYPY
jgi:hypothetical protein